jgi:small-conductance mechanosensitive channel
VAPPSPRFSRPVSSSTTALGWWISLKVSGSSDRELISAVDSVLSAAGQTNIGPTRQDFAPQLIIFGGTFTVLGLILAVVQTMAVGLLLSSGGLMLLAVGLRWRTAPASR